MKQDKKLHLAGCVASFLVGSLCWLAADKWAVTMPNLFDAPPWFMAMFVGACCATALATILEWSNCDTPWGNRWKAVIKTISRGRVIRGDTKWNWADWAITCVPAWGVTGAAYVTM